MKQTVWAVIPARFGSTRFPGKPLHMIAGKPLLQWVIEGSLTSQLVDQVIVATDDDRIVQLAEKCGVRAIMTDSDLPSGSDRIWAAVQNENVDILLNVQGDEPLVNGQMIDLLVKPLLQDPKLDMATLAHQLFLEDLTNQNVVKVITNQNSDAIYFSRFPIPYSRDKSPKSIEGAYKHIGMYAYRKSFLKTYCAAMPCEIEKAESLEQLRALYIGGRIRVIMSEQISVGVDSLDDVAKIERVLLSKRSL